MEHLTLFYPTTPAAVSTIGSVSEFSRKLSGASRPENSRRVELEDFSVLLILFLLRDLFDGTKSSFVESSFNSDRSWRLLIFSV